MNTSNSEKKVKSNGLSFDKDFPDNFQDNFSDIYPVSLNLSQSNNNHININIIRLDKRANTYKENISHNKNFMIKKVKKSEGDSQVEEFDENKFFPQAQAQSQSKAETQPQPQPKKNSKFGININYIPFTEDRRTRKSSIVFKDISKEDLKLVRERELTPVVESCKKLHRIDPPDFEQMDVLVNVNKSLEKLNLVSYHHDSGKDLINLRSSKNNYYPLHTGVYQIKTNEKSAIKLPLNCKQINYIYLLLISNYKIR